MMAPTAKPVHLGLIGSGIGRSMAPMLHEELGRLTGRQVTYRLYDVEPSLRSAELAELLSRLDHLGVSGVNVTHPFKRAVIDHVTVDQPLVAAIGSVNTVRFDRAGPTGFNTDYTGFESAYRHRFARAPGTVAQLGAGGFGRAAAFALAALGAVGIRLFDPDRHRSNALAADVAAATGVPIEVFPSAEAAAAGAHGIVNASPIGMDGHSGCPLEATALISAEWVFDAVYAPLETEFLTHARRADVAAMPGSDLFFWQGIHASEIFHRTELDQPTVAAAAAAVRNEIERRSAGGR